MHEDEAHYGRDQIAGLVNGERLFPDGKMHEVPSWAVMRSSMEHHGDVESEAFATVMDLERAIRMLGSRPITGHRRDMATVREAKKAAALLSCVLLLDWDVTDFQAAFSRGTPADRLVLKGIAWVATYLNGGTFTQCDAAFRRAH